MFPIIYLLFVYAFFTLLTLLFLFFNVYHMAKFGLQSGKTYFFLALYVGSFMSLLAFSLLLIVQIDWSREIAVSELIMGIFKPGSNLTLPL